MDPEVEKRFKRIEALLREGAERSNRMEARWEARWEKTEARWNRKQEEAMARLAKAELRMDRFERNLNGLRKVLESGMRMLVRVEARIDALGARVDDLAKMQQAFLRSQGNGKNGHNGRRRKS